MNVKTLQEVKVSEAELKLPLPPMLPYIGIAAVYREVAGPKRVEWSITDRIYGTAEAAYAEAAHEFGDYRVIHGTVRVFRIPGSDEAWTEERVRALARTFVGDEFMERSTVENMVQFARAFGVLEDKP